MSRRPVSWNQHWMPRALKAGVQMVEGDHYYASRTSVMGSGAFYSSQFGGWIHYVPTAEGKKYSLADHDYKPSETHPDGWQTKIVKKKHHFSQEALATEYERLKEMGASDKSRRVDGKDITYFVSEQERIAAEPEPVQAAPVESNGGDPSATRIIEVENTEKFDAFKENMWSWFAKHIESWSFTEEEKAELTREVGEFGLTAPQANYLLQVSVPKNMTEAQLRELMHKMKIEITEISV